jgi:hypothetical protein
LHVRQHQRVDHHAEHADGRRNHEQRDHVRGEQGRQAQRGQDAYLLHHTTQRGDRSRLLGRNLVCDGCQVGGEARVGRQ